MSDATLEAQEKKPADKPVPKAPFTELVTFRPWAELDKRFNNPKENVEAFRSKTKDGQVVINLRLGPVNGFPLEPDEPEG